MWCFRSILNISWVDKVTNAEVLKRLSKEPELINNIKIKKAAIFWTHDDGRKISTLTFINTGKNLR